MPAAPHRDVGGAGVMHARLSKILELEREGNVAVQVSFPAGVHATIPADSLSLRPVL